MRSASAPLSGCCTPHSYKYTVHVTTVTPKNVWGLLSLDDLVWGAYASKSDQKQGKGLQISPCSDRSHLAEQHHETRGLHMMKRHAELNQREGL